MNLAASNFMEMFFIYLLTLSLPVIRLYRPQSKYVVEVCPFASNDGNSRGCRAQDTLPESSPCDEFQGILGTTVM